MESIVTPKRSTGSQDDISYQRSCFKEGLSPESIISDIRKVIIKYEISNDASSKFIERFYAIKKHPHYEHTIALISVLSRTCFSKSTNCWKANSRLIKLLASTSKEKIQTFQGAQNILYITQFEKKFSQFLQKVKQCKEDDLQKENFKPQFSINEIQAVSWVLSESIASRQIVEKVKNHKSKKKISQLFLENLGNIFSQKFTSQKKYKSQFQKITKLNIRFSKETQQDYSQKVRKTNEILYRQTTVHIQKGYSIKILETNRQQFVYFQLTDNCHQITTAKNLDHLFELKNRADCYQSEQSESSESSEVVLDDEFYRINSKISNFSNMKNSFNSGQRLTFEGSDQNLLGVDYKKSPLFESTNAEKSEKKLFTATQEKISPQTKDAQFERSDRIFTSIDLALRPEKHTEYYARKKSCENPKTNRSSTRNEILINLIDESQEKYFTKDFKQFDCLFVRDRDDTVVLNKRKALIRDFFKKD